MKVIFFAFMLSVFIAGCANTPDYLASQPLATAEEKDAAQKNLLICVEENAKKLDDGISPANLVAESVTSACRDPFALVYKTQMQGQHVDVRRGFEGGSWDRTKVRMATSMILTIRARDKRLSRP